MKAFIEEVCGPAGGRFGMAEVKEPARDADVVLVKVLAVSVNPAHWQG